MPIDALLNDTKFLQGKTKQGTKDPRPPTRPPKHPHSRAPALRRNLLFRFGEREESHQCFSCRPPEKDCSHDDMMASLPSPPPPLTVVGWDVHFVLLRQTTNIALPAPSPPPPPRGLQRNSTHTTRPLGPLARELGNEQKKRLGEITKITKHALPKTLEVQCFALRTTHAAALNPSTKLITNKQQPRQRASALTKQDVPHAPAKRTFFTSRR